MAETAGVRVFLGDFVSFTYPEYGHTEKSCVSFLRFVHTWVEVIHCLYILLLKFNEVHILLLLLNPMSNSILTYINYVHRKLKECLHKLMCS